MARFPWLRPGDEEEKPKDDLEMKPDEVKKKFDLIDATSKDVTEIKGKFGMIDSIHEFIETTKREKEEARLAAAAKAETERQRKLQENTPEFEPDAEAAINAKLSPLVTENRRLQAKDKVREKLEDGSYEFYNGNVKQTMNNLIENSIKAGTVPSDEFLDNCYYVAVGRHQQEINEKKVKSRFTGAVTGGSGTGAPSDNNDKTPKGLSEQEKLFAKFTGVSEEDYAVQKELIKKETEYV